LILVFVTGGYCASLLEIADAVDAKIELRYRQYIVNDYDFTKEDKGKNDDYNSSMGKRLRLFLTAGGENLTINGELEITEDKCTAGTPTIHTLEDVKKNVDIVQCYGAVKEVSGLPIPVGLKLGRFELGEEFKSFIAYADRIEGGIADIKAGPVDIAAAVLKLKESGTIAEPDESQDKDETLYVCNITGEIPQGKATFFVFDRTQEHTYHDFSNVVIGAHVAGSIPQVKEFRYDIILASQMSESLQQLGKTAEGLGAKVNLSYETGLAGSLKTALEVIYTTADDEDTPDKDENFYGVAPNYSPLEFEKVEYTPIAYDKGIIRSNVTNLTAIALNVVYKPEALENLRLGLGVANYKKTEAEKPTWAAVKKDDIGTEIDITAEYAPTDNLVLGGMVGYFMPGDYYKGCNGKDTGEDAALKCMLEAKLTF
jgi:hypothetical protein